MITDWHALPDVRARQRRLREQGSALPAMRFQLRAPTPLLSVSDFAAEAQRRLPRMIWAYVEGGADDGWTMDANRRAFGRHALRQRVLTGTENVDLSVSVCGTALALPVMLAPTGLAGLVNWTGERAAARAAERGGTRAVISTAATYTPEEIAEATAESHWFQLYPWVNPELGARALTTSIVGRAHAAGYSALVVTVDSPTMGNRESEKRTGMGAPPTLTAARILDAARRPQWSAAYLRHGRVAARLLADQGGAKAAVQSARTQLRLMRPDLVWDDFAWIRERWDRKLLIKGVLDPADARRAVDLGADGVIVSNHGGRQLDGAPAALDALVDVAAEVPGVPVLVDGGFRRGTDVVKALCLGASAVLIGRPYLYGLAVAGESGVSSIIEIFRAEIERTLTFMGASKAASLNRGHLIPAPA